MVLGFGDGGDDGGDGTGFGKVVRKEPSPPDPDKWYLVLGMGETTGLWNV